MTGINPKNDRNHIVKKRGLLVITNLLQSDYS